MRREVPGESIRTGAQPEGRNQEMAKPIKVKLVRSPIGHPEKHRKVLRALGLTRLHKTVNLYGTPQIVGAVRKVIHFVEVTEG